VTGNGTADPVRLGVLGLGAVAQAVHLPLIARRPDLFRLAGVADLSRGLTDLIGERYNVPATRRHRTFGEMLERRDGLDAVLILNRGSHARQVAEAADAGLPMLCEKPLGYTTAEADALLARSPAPVLLLGYMKQYDPAVATARAALKGIGDVRSVDVTVLHPTGESQLALARVLPPEPLPLPLRQAGEEEDASLGVAALGEGYDDALWRAYRGALVSSLAHDVSVLRSLRQRPLPAEHAEIWRQDAPPGGRDPGRDRRAFGNHPPSITASGRLAGGGRYSLSWHYLPDFPAYRETVRVVHGRGTVELTFPSPYLLHAPTLLRVTASGSDAELVTETRATAEAFELQLEAFARLVRDGAPPYSGIADGRADIAWCQSVVAAHAQRAGLPAGGEIGRLISASTGRSERAGVRVPVVR
jgi:predicted dehydrogenase